MDASKQTSSTPKEEQLMQPVDWQAVRQALQEMAALVDGGELSPEMREQTLQRRATQVANRLEEQTAPQELIAVLELDLGQERYALPVQNIRLIAELEHLTPMPCVPSFYQGVTNLRGKIVSILDLGIFFDVPLYDAASRTQTGQMVVVAAGAGLEIGLLADSVATVVELARNTFVSGQSVGFDVTDAVQGVTKDGLILLDVDVLFHDSRLRIYEEVN